MIRYRGGSDLKREVLVWSSAPGPLVGPGRHAEAAEGGIVIGGAIGQSRPEDIARWHA